METQSIDRVRRDAILEVGLGGQLEIETAHAERGQDAGVADVVARFDGCDCQSEWQFPGQQEVPQSDRLDGESVAFHDGVIEDQGVVAKLNLRSRLQAADGYGDVVTGQGQSTHFGELQCHIIGSCVRWRVPV